MRDVYNEYWSSSGYRPIGKLSSSIERLFTENFQEGRKVLDVGCGDCMKSGPWASQHGCEYFGVDISESAIELARNNGFEASLIDDASSLPFPDASFDICLCMEVFEHLYYPHHAAREILRVLKPGGALIATVPNAAYMKDRFRLAIWGEWNPLGDSKSIAEPWRDPHIRFFTTKSLSNMLSQAGFKTVRVGGHDGGLVRGVLGKLPVVGPSFITSNSSVLFRKLERQFPALLGRRLHAIARSPDPV